MSGDLDRSVVYTFTLQSNLSQTLQEARSDITTVVEGTKKAEAGQSMLADQISATASGLNKQHIQLSEDVALMGVAKKSYSDISAGLAESKVQSDGLSGSLRDASDAASQVSENTKGAEAHQKKLADQVEMTNLGLNKQQIQLAKDIALINLAKKSYMDITNGLIGLGLVSDSTAQKIMQVNSAIQIFTGFANAYKLINIVMAKYNATQASTAAIETYRSVLNSPWKYVLVGAGLGVAAGVLGAYTYFNNQETSTQNTEIIIENTAGSVETANGINAKFTNGQKVLV